MILGWGIVILLLIMSIFLMSGRGSWLIAGYNTMSKEEKKEFDEKNSVTL